MTHTSRSHDLVPGGWVSPVAYLWKDREERGEFLVLCDHVPVFGEEDLGDGEGTGSRL